MLPKATYPPSYVAEGDITYVVFVQFCRLGQNSLFFKVMSRFCQVMSFLSSFVATKLGYVVLSLIRG
jgi:hypothetical protein